MEFKTVNQISQFGGSCPEVVFRKAIAELFEKFKQYEESLKEYLLLIRLEPNQAEHYYRAGILFEDRNRSDKAVNYFRKAIELSPRHSGGHSRLGLLLYKSKKPVEAKTELDLAIKYNPENYEAFFYIGRLMKESHDYVGALLAFEKAQKSPDFKVKAMVERGGCYISQNNYERAISELERAIKMSTSDSDPEVLFGRYFLAFCFERNREIDKAIEQWEKIYVKKPAFKDVAEKLSQYQDLRVDDRIKDYITSSKDIFMELCKRITNTMSLQIRDINEIPNGCQIIAVEAESKWRNARKMPKLLRFLRVPDIVDESTIRALHEEMKKIGVARGVIITSSNFSRLALDFAETRPIDLLNKEQLQELLKNVGVIPQGGTAGR
jgi:tetratricopeptide (TPR) repeat protein